MSNLLDIFRDQVHTIPQAVYNSAGAFGGRPANMYLEDNKWRTITYNDLIYKAECIGIGLMELGIEPGDRVGIKASTSHRWIWADLGSIFVGAASVSIYPTLSQTETTYIANHSGLKLLFVGEKALLYDILGYLPEMPEVKHVVCLEKGFRGDGKNIWGLGEIAYKGMQLREQKLTWLKERINALTGDDPATMIYTSGTTGALKGCMLTHKDTLAAPYRGYKHLYNYGHTEDFNCVALCFLPLSHIMEKINSYYGPLILGGMIGFPQSPATMTTDIQVIRPTWLMMVPRLISRIFLGYQAAFSATEMGKASWDWAIDVAVRATFALEDDHGRIDTTIPYDQQLTSPIREEWINAYNTVFWRIHHALGGRVMDLNCGGAFLEPDLMRKFVGMGFQIGYGYGLTETAAGIAETNPNAVKIGWISTLNPTVDLKFDEDGEILVKGPGIIREYYKNEAATHEGFTPDGYLRTGDLGEMDADGYIRLVDRKKNIMVLDTGKNVASGRIESLCMNTGLLDQVAILGNNRKFVGALIVPNLEVVVGNLKTHGVPYDESKLKMGIINGLPALLEVGEEVVNNEFVQEAVQAEVDKVNAQLEDYETIKAFRILNRRFTEETGEMTPSLKVKMRVVEKNYADLIDALYKR